jgi:hypothetical protein
VFLLSLQSPTAAPAVLQAIPAFYRDHGWRVHHNKHCSWHGKRAHHCPWHHHHHPDNPQPSESAQAAAALAKTLQFSSGRYWVSTADTATAFPILTQRLGILLNYMGQGPDMLIVACADVPSFKVRLDQISQLQTQLTTPIGLNVARKQYEETEAKFRALYQVATGKTFAGSSLDYWTRWGGTLDWVPYIELFGTDNCPAGSLPVETVVQRLFPARRDKSASILGNSTLRQEAPTQVQGAAVCECPSPRSGCSLSALSTVSLSTCYEGALCGLSALGGPAIDSCECSGPSCPQQPDRCTRRGLSSDGQSQCSVNRASCQGPAALYEDLYGMDKLYCCGCTQRSADTLPSGATTCPTGWTEGDQQCYDLGTGSCKSSYGLLQEGFTPKHCCRCLQPATGETVTPAGFWDAVQTLFNVFINGCYSYFDPFSIPIVSGLATAADVAQAAGPQAVWGVASELAHEGCNNRANNARAVMFVDSACTESYELDAGAFDVQCAARPSVGIEYPWVRQAAGCLAPAFYIKSDKSGQDCSGPFKWVTNKKPPGC